MDKLWIYGCSYSNDGHFPRTNKGWFDYISDEWGLEIINRSQAGTAWSYMKNNFYSDITHWNTNDIIIVESSHLQRMFSEFLQTRFEYFKYTPQTHCPIEPNDSKYLDNLLYITKDLDEIRRENWSQFVSSLLFLDRYIKNWFWWTFEFYPYSDELPKYIDSKFGNRLLKFENEIPTFNKWMRSNPKYCMNPPEDLHQTYSCHKIQGYLFIDQIKRKGYDRRSIPS